MRHPRDDLPTCGSYVNLARQLSRALRVSRFKIRDPRKRGTEIRSHNRSVLVSFIYIYIYRAFEDNT